MKEPVILSWSGGKDSALALHELRRSPDHEVVGLLTTVTGEYDRISMHGVRRELLRRQAASLGLPLTTVEIPATPPNGEYERRMGGALADFHARGIRTVAFGDLFLADIRRYREQMVAALGMRALFPVWGRDTARLARDFLDLGFRAVLTCVDSQALAEGFAGRPFDRDLLRDLPAGVDPCGENGEFHTFVSAGPLLAAPVPYETGAVVLRDERFYFCDLVPV